MPIAALHPSPSAESVRRALAAVLVAIAVAVVTAGHRPRGWRLAGPVTAAAAAVLYDVSAPGLITVVLGGLAGAAAGVTSSRPWRPLPWFGAGAAMSVAIVVVVRAASSEGPALAVAVALTAVAAAAGLVHTSDDAAPASRPSGGRLAWLAPVIALALTAGLLAWTGANDPQLTWFGPVVSRGPSTGNRVAITFDDGPNDTATLAVRDILDRYGVKATFFLVGKALDARPDIARALLADGMLLGGHSYHHDNWRWLDPRYPELQRTVDAFRRQLGVCPRYYRPPHGQRTPFVSLALSRHDMKAVDWNVSAGDWATDDAGLVARRVLRAVRPGAIILLHDGLDGHVHADRSVIVAALPRILAGLQARGLQPVRVDQLIGGPAYEASC
jgi:peptidoglycan/xylan/chitin deacetylase (PgdA/CDA1 family)